MSAPSLENARSIAERDVACCKRLCNELKMYKSTVIGSSQQDANMLQSASSVSASQSGLQGGSTLDTIMDLCHKGATAHSLMLGETTKLQHDFSTESVKRYRTVADAWSAKFKHLEGSQNEIKRGEMKISKLEQKGGNDAPAKIMQARRSLSVASERANSEKCATLADWRCFYDGLRMEYLNPLVNTATALQALESADTMQNRQNTWQAVQSAAKQPDAVQNQISAKTGTVPAMCDVFSDDDRTYALALRQHLDRACALSIVGGNKK